MGEVLTPSEKVVYRDLEPGKGGVLLHLETGAYHGVNDVKIEVFERIANDWNIVRRNV